MAGLSKLARTVEVYAKRLQLQGADDSADRGCADGALCPKGVIVMAEAEHLCMTMRGVKKAGNNDGERCGKRARLKRRTT